MKLRFTEKADKDYAGLPVTVRKVFGKQLYFLLANLRHPSLHAKKYSEAHDVWQARVTQGWRFYFKRIPQLRPITRWPIFAASQEAKMRERRDGHLFRKNHRGSEKCGRYKDSVALRLGDLPL